MTLHHHSIPRAEVTPSSGFHSHNDFWREYPIISALKAGCIGIEADVWVYGDELFVGHGRDALAPQHTFTALYVEPLMRLLEEKNMGDDSSASGHMPRGLFDQKPEQTLVLLVDVKTEPELAWPLLVEAAEPLRQRGWLTTVRNGVLASGPLTIVAGGKISEQPLRAEPALRDILLDAPLSDLDRALYNSNNSYWASASFKSSVGLVWKGDLSNGQLSRLRRHVQEAHRRGLKVRYWGVPSWPFTLRQRIWDILSKEGVDVINADNLADIERYGLVGTKS